jgi:hypothetical protein
VISFVLPIRKTVGRVKKYMMMMSRTVAMPSIRANPRTGPTARKYRITRRPA